ncbi:MAG TPA: helical backbone metal receptor [Streptosporangiaceae bacterium]|nr:helical backbone metal receptor [Streptosporangiaceae bacterium]
MPDHDDLGMPADRRAGPGAARDDVAHDDVGNEVKVPRSVARVVSLVPSLTEAVASCAPRLLVGATNWCTHPADLAVARIGGTKNPGIEQIVGLAPDMVLANEEENRKADLDALRAAGLAVWVTRVRNLPEALTSLGRMLTVACGLPGPAWLEAAAAAWRRVPRAVPGPAIRTAVIPVWRRPWMVLGHDTFAGDLLARLGVANLYSDHAERYPRVGIEEIRDAGADLVVLPDEPYRFSASDGPEAFPGDSTALVSGRHLTWYGPSLTEAPAVLARQLLAARVRCPGLPAGRGRP